MPTFYLIGKQDYHVDPYILRNAIARWYFMTSLTGRYTSSPETAMDQDLARFARRTHRRRVRGIWGSYR
ncbi:MAG: hypothetical protein R2856_27980 [Caldilineaceae bacterium]